MFAVAALVYVVIEKYKPGTFGAQQLFAATVFALFAGAGLAVSAAGLVVTYTTSGIFNFAHGAIGMLGAFAYWQLRFQWHVPAPLALVLVICVAAPLFGAALEVVLMRKLAAAPLAAQLVVTVSLLFVIVGVSNWIWDLDTDPQVKEFFASSKGYTVFGVNVSWHYTITILVGLVLAVALRVFLYRSRAGITMRAVVDNRELVALNGARPQLSGMLAWALSSSLAVLAGILLLPNTGLNKAILTLSVIDAFAAAIIGRLRSLPLTFAGAMLLSMVQSSGRSFFDFSGRWQGVPFALPSLFLLVALLFLPQDRIEIRQFAPSRRLFRVPKLREAAIGFAVLTAFIFSLSYLLNDFEGLNKLTAIMTLALLLLSLVPLTGWSGQVSLGQVFFVGVGFWGFGSGLANGGNPLGFLRAAAVAAIAGAVVALPALRLKGLDLALATFSIASAATYVFYSQAGVMQSQIDFHRPVILGINLASQRSYLVFCCIVFSLVGMVLVALRRGRFGRRLIALKDSPAACATLGVNLTVTKLLVFMLSAAIAGLAGAMIAMDRLVASEQDPILSPIQGLGTVLFLVIGGSGLIGGAFAGGFFSEFINFIKSHLTVSPFTGLFKTLEQVGPGLAALNIIANPDGIAGAFSDGIGPKLPWRRNEPETVDPDAIPSVSGAGHSRAFTVDDLATMNDFLRIPVAARQDLDTIAPESLIAANLSTGS